MTQLSPTDASNIGATRPVVVVDANGSTAIDHWTEALGESRVIVDSKTLKSFSANAIGSSIVPIAVLRPARAEQVQKIVGIAAEQQVAIYPISTGRNWGYGAASPVRDGCAVLDLSDLRQIRVIDDELGVLELEPGVTQGMLAEYLQRHGIDRMVPVHGGGPDCSLVGNALERGYGLTPTTDHFLALTSLQAVLPDGSTYRSGFHAMGAERIGASHRWGVGPYVEGLFSQGNFGVVTSATFALQRKPQHTEAFFVRLRDQDQFEETVESIRTLLGDLDGVLTGVNLMNDRRVLSMSREYPRDRVAAGGIMSRELVDELLGESGATAWTLAGIIQSPSALISPLRKHLRRALPPGVARPFLVNRRRIAIGRRVVQSVPLAGSSVLQQLDSIEAFLDLAEGMPRRVALSLAYWLDGHRPDVSQSLNPAKDHCGLIWYSPLVPMKRDVVRDYVHMVETVCESHGIEPLITLTSLSERLFDSTVPILYRKSETGAADRAQACYEALYDAGKQLGCLPYRVTTQSMGRVAADGFDNHFDFVSRLKQAIDPSGIVAPGRYSS
ncbi:MAG: FAD-binding oxidoreductase [Planctomycetota bacterium]